MLGIGKEKRERGICLKLLYFLLMVATQCLILFPKIQQYVIEEGGPGALGHKPREPAVKDASGSQQG